MRDVGLRLDDLMDEPLIGWQEPHVTIGHSASLSDSRHAPTKRQTRRPRCSNHAELTDADMVDQWSPEQLADASGESVDDLATYAETGLLVRQADGRYDADALHRLELLQFARERGITPSQLGAAVAEQGDLLGIFEGLGSEEPTSHTLGEAAAKAGLDNELIAELVEILGWKLTAKATNEDVDALDLLVQALTLGLPREALVQQVRVYADLLDRLADAEVRIFHDYVHEQFRAAGMSGRELLEATESLGKPLLGLVEPAILYFHRRAWDRVNKEDLLRHLLEVTTPPAAQPGESTATVMFIDLADFTPLTVAMGDQGAADVLREFGGWVRSTSAANGGRIIKQIGDAFMLTFLDPCDAVRFGLDLQSAVAARTDFPAMHIGAHHGRVLFTEGDYVGGAVNLAARVASASAAGQFLVTAEIRDIADGQTPAKFLDLGQQSLKGIASPVPLVEVAATHR
jgi:adenylate cyclase